MLIIAIIVAILIITPAMAITEEELIAMEEDATGGNTGSNTVANEITLYWGDNITLGPFIINAAGFSSGTQREDKSKCNSDKYSDYEKKVFFGCMDYVILRVFHNNEEWDTILSDHNITIQGEDLTNVSVYEPSRVAHR